MTESGIDGQDPQLVAQSTAPNFHLSPEALEAIDHQIIEASQKIADDSMVACWVSPNHPFANFMRRKEADHFPEVEEADDYYDNHQVYLALADTRGDGRVVHGASFMSFDTDPPSDEGGSANDRTGFYTIDSLIELGNFTRAEFISYYEAQGIDLRNCISIETNFKIPNKDGDSSIKPYLDMGTADLTYLTLFNSMIDHGASREGTVVFATINEAQAKSLDRAGITYESLMGRQDFETEEADLGKVSTPVAINFASAYDIFKPLGFKLPELNFK